MQDSIKDLACLHESTVSAASWVEEKISKQDGNSAEFRGRTFDIKIQMPLWIIEFCGALFPSVS